MYAIMNSMRKIYLTAVLLVLFGFGVSRALAQSTEPGIGLPLLDDTVTATVSASYGSTVAAFTTVTAVRTVSSSQQAVDDADTGSEMIVLVILSITGGVGIFLIKKYFDFKRYSL